MEKSDKVKIILEAIKNITPIIREKFLSSSHKMSYKKNESYVSETDLLVEHVIVDTLKSYNPAYSFLLEESGVIKRNQVEHIYFRWIIDPIDGTFNFIHGSPNFGVSIALEYNLNNYNEIIAGAIYLPIYNEIFLAEKNKGAYKINCHGEERSIFVSNRTNFEEVLIGTGEAFNKQKKNILKQINTNYLQTRISGAATIDFASISSGIYDILIIDGLKPWDLAAGMLLVQEAGGIVVNFEGETANIYDKDIIASNPMLLNKLHIGLPA